jgi:sugar O-acyltransferase (sialic acid O-acetyltransferase NeuD family)
MKVILLGAGGHAQVVADIVRSQGRAGENIVFGGYLDDRADRLSSGMSADILGTIAGLANIEHDALVVAIGNNSMRRDLFDRARESGARFTIAKHPAATVAADVSVGPGSMICAGVVINTGSMVGANTIVNTSASVDHHCRVGDHVHIGPGVHLGGEVTIGEGVLVGIGAIVLPGRTVGDWAVVGAGAVVVDDVAPKTTVIGVPARCSTPSPDEVTSCHGSTRSPR